LSQTIKRIYPYRVHILFWFLCTGFLFIHEGCTSRVEGCLDVAAANFDFSADRSCEDCCTYPLLSISLSQKWGARNFSTADSIFDKNGKVYRIRDLKYFLSSWSWRGSDQHNYTIDSAMISCNGGFLMYTPDIILVDSRQFQYTLGTIRQSPVIDSVHLKLGLLPALDCIDGTSTGIPSVFSTASALWDKQTASRASVRLVLQKDTSMQTFDTIFIHTLLDIDLGYDLNMEAGKQTTLVLTVDYAKWFSDADIMLPNSFQASIETGVKDSFYKSH
jgi:hypothetical protein